jgi:hypothetical protein
MLIKYNLSQSDFVNASCIIYLRVFERKPKYNHAFWLAPAGLFVMTTVPAVIRHDLTAMVVTSAICVLMFALGKPLLLKVTRMTAERTVRQPRYRDVFGEQSLEVTSQGLIHRTPIGQVTVGWDKLGEVLVKDGYGLIFLSSSRAIVIPSGSVKDGDFGGFIEDVSNRVSQKNTLETADS